MKTKRLIVVVTACAAALFFAVVAAFATTEFLTVSPGDPQGWTTQATPGATPAPAATPSVTFVANPTPTPPLGTGSAQLSVGSDGGATAQLRHGGYAGTVLPTPTPTPTPDPNNPKEQGVTYPAAPDELTELRYSTYVQHAGTGDEAPYVVLHVDYTNDGTGDDTLVFEPQYQASNFCPRTPQPPGVTAGQWQTWETLGGCWYSTNGEAGSGPGAGVKPLRVITATHPGAKIVNPAGAGGVRVVAGGGAGAWDNFVGDVDVFRIGVGEDGDGNPNLTIYDFEPSAAPPPADADVVVNKDVDAATSVADRDVTYTITVMNVGPGTATGLHLTDKLPGNMTFVSLSQTGNWTCDPLPMVGDPGTVTCDGASLAVSSPQTFTLVGHIPASPSPNTVDMNGSYFSNTATVTTSSNDTNPVSNSASASTRLVTCLSNPEVTTNADDGNGSLRQAVADACAGSTITFNTSRVVSPVTLTTGEIFIDKNLTIQGPTTSALTVSGNDNSRVFDVDTGAAVAISNLTIADGRDDFGGGIYNLGDLTISNCTFTGNDAVGDEGGAIDTEDGTLFVVNSTISGNTAATDGGGLLNCGSSVTTLVNVTVTNNRADADGDTTGDGGGIAQVSSNAITLHNTIVAGNSKGTGSTADDFFVLPGSAVNSASSNNLIGADTGHIGGLTNGNHGNQIGTSASPINPLLGALADNGGPTKTHRLLPGSPAINKGDNTKAKDKSGSDLTTDQRGFARVVNTTVDIGAVEVNYAINATAGTPQGTATNTNFATPLQATLTESGLPVAGLTVTFSAPASGASGTFPSGNTAVTDANGRASVAFKANATLGSYDVTANITPALATPATFHLTNLAPGTIQFGSASYQQGEAGPTAVINVTRAGGSAGAVSVNFATSAGTATGGASCAAGVDFVNTSGTLSWADGDAADKTFAVTICEDSSNEPNETVNLALSNLTGPAAFGSQTTSTLTLTDNDPRGGVIEFAAAVFGVAERGGQRSVNVKRTGDTTRAASVEYATDDGSIPSVAVPCSATTGAALHRCDYTHTAGTLQFAAGETLKTFSVPVNDDSYVEGTETARLVLSSPGGGAALGSQSQAALQIDDDVPESAGNPIDDDRNFVRQQYHDFLGREPDAEGWDFWTNGITSCGADAGCREVKRIDTSAAFFLSIEFRETGYFVYLTRKAAFGDIAGTPVPVRVLPFLRDTQAIGRGVVVGQGAWQAQLEANKQAFLLAFVQTGEFRARYPDVTSATAFVNSLDSNAGGVLTQSEKSALVSELSPNPSDPALRASVLKKVASNQTLVQKEINRAFVLMQYFGYLRRDPDAAPDTNFDGYNFWLAKLDQFGGDYRRAEMVKAFLSSAEYRQRFGQQ
jgi:uncharacterized repeat protein (TIGR01451 family)